LQAQALVPSQQGPSTGDVVHYIGRDKVAQRPIVPPNDSDLGESDDEVMEPEVLDEESVLGGGDIDSNNEDEESDQQDELSGSESDVETTQPPPSKKRKDSYKWKKVQLDDDVDFSWTDGFPEPLENFTPLEYFKLFVDDDIIDNIVEQTNIYSFQKHGSSVNTNKKEVEQFVSCSIMMGLVRMPSYKMYWDGETRYEKLWTPWG